MSKTKTKVARVIGMISAGDLDEFLSDIRDAIAARRRNRGGRRSRATRLAIAARMKGNKHAAGPRSMSPKQLANLRQNQKGKEHDSADSGPDPGHSRVPGD